MIPFMLAFAASLLVACALITAWCASRDFTRSRAADKRAKALEELDGKLAESTRVLTQAQDEYTAMLRGYTRTIGELAKRRAPN